MKRTKPNPLAWDTSIAGLRDFEVEMPNYYVDLYDLWVERILTKPRRAYSFVEWNETGTAADVAASFKAAGDLRSALQRAPSHDFKLWFHVASGGRITRWCETRRDLLRQRARRMSRCGRYGALMRLR